jgi:nuclear GTP-binding protein
MVKKKGKSKRTSLQDKYKIERKIVETHRKRRKQAKKDAASGKVIPKKKDPGIPNSWPFKQELLGQIQQSKDRQTKKLEELKEKRKLELQALRQHQAEGGSARTVQELMAQATADQDAFRAKQQDEENDSAEAATATAAADATKIRNSNDSKKSVGQPSRRAYLKELKKVVESSDVILQVLDARDPIATRAMHPSIVQLLESSADKRLVMVLNKIDLVPKAIVGEWLSYLRKSHPAIAIKANHGFGHTGGSETEDATKATKAVGMDGLLQLLKNYARTGVGKNKTSIVVGVVGYPNVG